MTKSEDTIRLEKAVDGARRIVKPETKAGKRFTEWLSEPVDDRGYLYLTKHMYLLKTKQYLLINKLDMAANVVKQLAGRLLDKEK